MCIQNNQPAEIVECSFCENQATVINDNNNYCNECYESETTECAHCNDRVSNDETTTLETGEIYCDDCTAHHTFWCEDCENTFSEDQCNRIRGGDRYVCDGCYEEYTLCYHCGDDVISTIHSDDTGHDYCEECFCNTHNYCEECGNDVHFNNWDSLNSCCENCSNDKEQKGIKINNYSFKPNPIFFRAGKESIYGGPGYSKKECFFGIELEIEGTDREIEIPTILTDVLYFKDDGSLNTGFEIVSHPITYSALTRIRADFKKLFSTLVNAGYRSYDTDTCGMHIHISKAAFNSMHLFRFLKFFKDNADKIVKISQRKKSNLERWASLTGEDMQEESIKYKCKNKNLQNSRYCAVNLMNRNSVEIRIFRGTLNIASFYKNIEFIECLYNYTKENSHCSWEGFKESAKSYRNLNQFLNTKNI